MCVNLVKTFPLVKKSILMGFLRCDIGFTNNKLSNRFGEASVVINWVGHG